MSAVLGRLHGARRAGWLGWLRSPKLWCALPLLAYLALFLVVPITMLLRMSFVAHGGLSLDNYARLARSDVYLDVLGTTFKTAAWTTLFAVLGGYPVAYLATTAGPRLKSTLLFWTLLPCMMVLLLTGVVIWRRYFSGYFPIDIIRLAALAHSAAAFALIVAIMVHIYAGIWIQGTLGAMLHGYVTPGWARKHHPKWFRSIIKSRNLH